MLYNRKAVRQYMKDTAGVSVSSDFWIALNVTFKKVLDTAIKRNRNFKRITSAELGFNSELLKVTDALQSRSSSTVEEES